MSAKWINLTDKEREILIELLPSDNKLREKLVTAGKRIKISSAKQKGKGLQFWVCERISRITGIPYEQGDDQCEIHSREMGQAGTDIVLRGEAYKRFPFDTECKNTESLALMATVEQAKANTKAGRNWLIVHKNKRLSNPIVVMQWDAFEELMVGR